MRSCDDVNQASDTVRDVHRGLIHRQPPTSAHPRYFLAHVTQVAWLTPRIRRITLGGADIDEFVSAGADQRVKLFLPRPHQTTPLIPSGPHGWRRAWHALPHAQRPVPRTYTIRHHRPQQGEVDIDFIVRHDGGPGCQWARRAQPGGRLGMYGPGSGYQPTPTAHWQLLIGDDAALPAIAAILESLPDTTRADVYLETADDHEQHYVRLPDGARVTWVPRGASPRERSDRLLAAVHTARFPVGDPYAWIAGEQKTVAAVRHHLIQDRGLNPHAIYTCRYWRRDGPTDEH